MIAHYTSFNDVTTVTIQYVVFAHWMLGYPLHKSGLDAYIVTIDPHYYTDMLAQCPIAAKSLQS